MLLSGLLLPTSHAAATVAEETNSPITDRARLIPRGLAERLAAQLVELEERTGLRVRVQTVSAGVSAASAYGAAGCDVLLVADTRASNMLVTRVAEATYERIPRTFFVELPNRYGTKFYVEQHGADGAIAAAIDAIARCAAPASGRLCKSVPDVSSDQLTISVACAALAGCIAGAASRTEGKSFNLPFLLLFSPIWSIFLISFGFGPVLTRLESPLHIDAALVALAFILPALALWYWIPRGIGPPNDLNA